MKDQKLPCALNASSRNAARGWLALCCLTLLAAAGCEKQQKRDYKSVSEPQLVRLIQPPVRKIVRVVGQPSFVDSYERTSIYPKMTAYIEKWIVDIGDRVKTGDVLATLFVPELVEDYGTKKATVKLDEERIDLALKAVDVASADVEAAQAQLEEAQAILADYQSQVDRWDVQVERLAREVERGVVDPQVLLESQNQLNASKASRDSAQARISRAKAELLSKQATLAKANVDVAVARADLAVAQSEERRLKAWVGYLNLYAPFDGVIVARNANTGDFVLPATGDPTAMQRAPHLSPGGGAAPIYVVDRLDIVRVYVDIPEAEADFVNEGTKASVLIRAYRDDELPASVTRVSWALNVTTRTLRAEIDLHNTDAGIRPGMYAYGKVMIERPDVRALPESAVAYSGERIFCWLYEDGHAVQTEIEVGVSDGDWIEVTRRRKAIAQEDDQRQQPWSQFDGSEQVILGDLSLLTDGAAVRISSDDSTAPSASAGSKDAGDASAAP